MAIFQQNFNTFEQRQLAVTSTTGHVEFTTTQGINADDLMIVNEGPNGCQLNYGVSSLGTVTAVQNASAGGTRQTRIPAGAVMIIGKGSGTDSIAAVCESGQTAALSLHSGKGG